MAKSQSTKKTTKQEASAKPAAPAKKPAGKKSAGGDSSGAVPAINTNLAASAAAAMILNRAVTGQAGSTPAASAPSAPRKETSAFKNLKENLNKPTGAGLGGILGPAGQNKKSNQPFGGGNQVGRNQTFGADINRSGVPRRTSG